MVQYLFGDNLIVALLAFGGAMWIASKAYLGRNSWLAVILGALVLAAFTTDLPLMIARDGTTTIALIGLLVLAGQQLLGTSLAETASLLVIVWLVAYTVINQSLFNLF